MLVFAKSLCTKPGDLDGYRFTRPKGLVQCESILVMDSTHPARMQGSHRWTDMGTLLLSKENIRQDFRRKKFHYIYKKNWFCCGEIFAY